MTKRRILVIEDDAAIRRGVVDALKAGGYVAVQFADGESGLEAAGRGGCDLVLLDLVLPGLGGLEVLAALRESSPTVPVIILTALGDETDRVRGLELGADDYVVKPFSVRELLARVEAVLRRTGGNNGQLSELRIPGGTVDFNRLEVRFDDKRREALSELEAGLLRYLATNAGRAVPREELLWQVWGFDPRGIATRTVDMHVARTREKLGDEGDRPQIIVTVRGKGYMLGETVTWSNDDGTTETRRHGEG